MRGQPRFRPSPPALPANTAIPSFDLIDAVVLLHRILNRIRDGFETNSPRSTGILAVPISSNLQETQESRQEAGLVCAGRGTNCLLAGGLGFVQVCGPARFGASDLGLRMIRRELPAC